MIAELSNRFQAVTCRYCRGSGRTQECRFDPVFVCDACDGSGKLQICSECGEREENCECEDETEGEE